jgi:hypothetical protein
VQRRSLPEIYEGPIGRRHGCQSRRNGLSIACPQCLSIASCLLAVLLTVKVYRVIGTKGRKRPMLEASIMEVKTEQPGKKRST